MNLQLPEIHFNGTGKESLIESLCNASNALNDAYAALRQASPNGRDYYTQGPDAMERATREHLDRMKRLDEIKLEIDWMTCEIAEK